MATPLSAYQAAVCHGSGLMIQESKAEQRLVWPHVDESLFSLCLCQAAVGRGTRSPAGPAPTSTRWWPSPAPNISSTSPEVFPHVRLETKSGCLDQRVNSFIFLWRSENTFEFFSFSRTERCWVCSDQRQIVYTVFHFRNFLNQREIINEVLKTQQKQISFHLVLCLQAQQHSNFWMKQKFIIH